MEHFFEATPIKVIRKRENGSGIIEIPIAAVTTGQGGELEITSEIIAELVANFASFPLVPSGTSPHVDFGQRSGFSTAFINSVELRDGVLFGQLDLVAGLYDEVVEQGGWRGFSVEIHKDVELQTRMIPGWTLTGGVFTNRGDVRDAHFKIAAEGIVSSERTATHFTSLLPHETGKGSNMADQVATPANDGVKMAAQMDLNTALVADKKALETRVADLSAETRLVKAEKESALTALQVAKDEQLSLEAKVTRLEADARTAKATVTELRAGVERLSSELAVSQAVNLDIKVQEVIDEAIAAKVPPANFEGHDAGPGAWMQGIYTSFDSFKKQVETMLESGLVVGKGVQTKSGHDSKKGSDLLEGLSAKEASVLKKHVNLGVDFSSATNADEARELLEAAKAAKGDN